MGDRVLENEVIKNLLKNSEFDEIPDVGQPLQSVYVPLSPGKSRFEPVKTEDINIFVQEQRNKNTKLTLDSSWINSYNHKVNIELLSPFLQSS